MTGSTVSLALPTKMAPPPAFGVDELKKALVSHGYRPVEGKADYTITVAREPSGGTARESYRIAQPSATALSVSAADENGLLYGCLDLAEQLDMGRDLGAVEQRTGVPDLQVRGLYTFLLNSESERDWLYDPTYWQAYADELARCRYNRFNLIYGHQSPHLIPIYAFMLDDLAQEFPQIQVKDITSEERARNLKALQDASSAMNGRGLTFFLGIWNSRPWKTYNGVWETQPTRVTGTDDLGLLTLYTRKGFTRLMELCPDIKGIQMRMNIESGIADQRFFVQAYVPALKDLAARGRRITIELRNWGLHPDTIEAFRGTGLDIVVSTKYFAEHQGMPYQPPVTRGSYSYDSFLRKDKPFPFQWHVWNLGSHRLFAWGDPDHARRFAESCHLGDGVGFEVTPPGSQKGFSEWGEVYPGDWQARLDLPQQWDFQRYWFFHKAFGRMTFDTKTGDEVFLHELAKRTTLQAAPGMLKAYRAASQVVSYLISMRMDDPNMYVWPELDCGGPIDHNTIAPPGEETLFSTARAYAHDVVSGKTNAKRSPFEQAADLAGFADAIEAELAQLERMPGLADKPEYRFTSVDFKAVAALARYHAAKQRAGGNLALFYAAGDRHALDLAEAEATAAIALWDELCRRTTQYYDKLHFGPSGGHWKHNTPRVRYDQQRIQRVRELFDTYGVFTRGFDFGPGVTRFVPSRWMSGLDPEPRFAGANEFDVYSAEKGYGWLKAAGIRSHGFGEFTHEMVWGVLNFKPGVQYDPAIIEAMPLDGLTHRYVAGQTPHTFRVDVPDGDYQVTLIVPAAVSTVTQAQIGGARVALGQATATTAQVFATAAGGKIEITVGGSGPWALAGLVIRPRKPLIAHIPPLALEAGKDANLTATVTAPGKLTSCCLRYETPQGGSEVLVWGKQGMISAAIPASALTGKTFEYVLAAEDESGHSARLGPFRIPIIKDFAAPRIAAAGGPASWSRSGKLTFHATLEHAACAREVILHYREADQNRNFRTAAMMAGHGGEFTAEIDPLPLDDNYELMYYFEVIDVLGRGSFYPDPFSDARYRISKPQNA